MHLKENLTGAVNVHGEIEQTRCFMAAKSSTETPRRAGKKNTVAVNLWKPLAYLVMLILSPFVLLVDCFRTGKRVNGEWIFAFSLLLTLSILFTGICILISEGRNNRVFALMSHFTDSREQIGENVQYSQVISMYALKYNVDPLLVSALIARESSYNPIAVSPRKAKGLMQISPVTWQEMNPESICEGEHMPPRCHATDCIYCPEANIATGIRYLSRLIRRYDGQVGFALEAYNAGSSNVDVNDDSHPFAETRSYTRGISERLKALRQDRVLFGVQMAVGARKAVLWTGISSAVLWMIMMVWILRKV